MKKLIVLALVILAVCLTFAACSCEHQYEEKITTEASCSAIGIKTFTCTKCNDSYTEEIPMIEHSFGTATVTKEPTCTEEGEKSVTCKACGTSKVTDTVSKKSHAYVSEITTESTCAVAGVKTYTCSVCNDSYTEPLPMLSHTWTSKVTTEPTCTAEGVKTFTCTECAESRTEAVAQISHTEVIDAAKKATCTSTGLTEGKHCSACSTIIVAQKTIPKGAHTEVVDKGTAATCTSTGLTDGKHCSVCNTTTVKQQVLEKTSHNDPHGICLDCNKVTNETKAINHYFDVDTSYATGKYVKTYYDYSLHVEYYIMYISSEISITNSYDGRIAVTIDFEIDGFVEREGPYYTNSGFMNYVIMLGDITVSSGHTTVYWGDADLFETVFLDSIDELEYYYGDGTFYINLGNYYM